MRTFKANKKTDFDSVMYQPDGSVMLNYSEKVEQQGTSGKLPEMMQIGIPIYFRGEAYQIDVLVRYRVGGGGVKFDLSFDRLDVVEDHAFKVILDGIATATEVPVLIGEVA